eukprot:9437934-Pyramimonas_sp.AAC.1
MAMTVLNYKPSHATGRRQDPAVRSHPHRGLPGGERPGQRAGVVPGDEGYRCVQADSRGGLQREPTYVRPAQEGPAQEIGLGRLRFSLRRYAPPSDLISRGPETKRIG